MLRSIGGLDRHSVYCLDMRGRDRRSSPLVLAEEGPARFAKRSRFRKIPRCRNVMSCERLNGTFGVRLPTCIGIVEVGCFTQTKSQQMIDRRRTSCGSSNTPGKLRQSEQLPRSEHVAESLNTVEGNRNPSKLGSGHCLVGEWRETVRHRRRSAVLNSLGCLVNGIIVPLCGETVGTALLSR